MRDRRSFEGIRRTCVGLVAALLLLPTLAPGSLTVAPDCCTGRMCPIHHKMTDSGAENSHIDCEHEGMTVPSCSMSCSHSDEQQIETTVFFLLPRTNASLEWLPMGNAVLLTPAFHLDRSIRPLTPPPRF